MKYLLSILFICPLFLISQTQIGQDIDGEEPLDKLSDSGALSLSSNGNIVAIGSRDNDGNGYDSGHVRIYENQSGTWIQLGQDIDGEESLDQSGWSVSLSSDGSIVAIGAVGNDENGENSGHVRVYENQLGTWVQIGQDINGGVAYERSGNAVSLSSDGSIVAIGAYLNNVNGSQTGKVRIYENQLGTWVQIGQDIDGEVSNELLGRVVSLSSDGSTVAIGVPGYSENSDHTGHVRIYQNQSGIWVQIGSDFNSETDGDGLGISLSLSSDGSIIAMGANGNNGNGDSSGHVRIYENQNNNWVQLGSDIDGEAEFDRSGSYVSMSTNGNIVAIGAWGNDGNGTDSGHVRIYKNQSGNWVQLGSDINGEAAGDYSGVVSLSSDGSIVAIGAQGNDGNNFDSGHVRVYSIASELGLLEVVEDILSNANGVNITAEELNGIIGVSGAIDGVNYTLALQNGTYVDPNNPTAAEIQAVINQVNDTLGLSNVELSSFNLYPNPTKNQFTIQLNTTSILKQVTIYNTLGQQVLTSENTVVDTSKLASGSYIVEVLTTKGKASKQLIIE